jgi:adhesin/invasin
MPSSLFVPPDGNLFSRAHTDEEQELADRNAKRRLKTLVVMAMTTALVAGGFGMANFAVDSSPAAAAAVPDASAGPPHAPTSTLTVSSGSQIAGSPVGFHRADYAVKDQEGTLIPHVDVDFLFTFPDGSTEKRVADSGVYGSGFELVFSSIPGYVTIAATIGGSQLSGSPASVQFVPAPVSPSRSTMSGFYDGVPADGVSEHTGRVLVRDSLGGDLKTGVQVDFNVPPELSASALSVISDADGYAYVSVRSSTPGEFQISATINGESVANSPRTAIFLAGAPDESMSHVTVTPDGPVVADGTSAYTATVLARDAAGFLVRGATVAFDFPAQVSASAATCTTAPDGTCSVRFTATRAGIYTVTTRFTSP